MPIRRPRHVIVEFSFDVVQAASGGYVSDMYQSFIGFQVAKPVLERAFLRDLRHGDEGRVPDRGPGDSARIATPSARRSREITRIAWRDKREEIEKLNPGRGGGEVRLQPVPRGIRTRRTAPTTRSRACWRGSSRSSTGCCRRSARSGRCSSRRRRRKPRRCFSRASRTRASGIAPALDALGRGRLDLPNTDFDTGKPSAHGEYTLADETYAELLDRLTRATTSPTSRRAEAEHQRVLRRRPSRVSNRKERKRTSRDQEELEALNATAASDPTP